MSNVRIRYEKPLKGEISIPPDKSISHRAVIISSLSEGKSRVRNFLYAEDPLRTVEAFRQMGVRITGKRGKDPELVVEGKGLYGLQPPERIIDCGNSGTTMRLMCGVLSGQPFSASLKGDPSLMRRPMQRVITPLAEMGAVIISEKGGYPPLTVSGRELKPIDYTSPVASAQVKSAVLLAGLFCSGVTRVSEPERSRDHTERMLKAAGVDIEIRGLTVSVTGKATPRGMDTTIPGDFSSAAFFIVAATIVSGSEILIENVGINPTRTGLLDILERMGARITLHNKREVSGEPVSDIHVKSSQLDGLEIGGDIIPSLIDELPILCIAASVARGITKFTGAGELRVKESDRIATMSRQLRTLGVEAEELPDGIVIRGREKLRGAVTQSYGDHRIAMSMAVAGLAAEGYTTVIDTDCINTSFPDFFKLLMKLQA